MSPILPENRHLYPDNWQEIRTKILERARHRCESCTVHNHDTGYRDGTGAFFSTSGVTSYHYSSLDQKIIKIVLTIAHLDHDPTNNDEANLRAWCQKCHNTWDAPHRAETRRKRRHEGQLELRHDQ